MFCFFFFTPRRLHLKKGCLRRQKSLQLTTSTTRSGEHGSVIGLERRRALRGPRPRDAQRRPDLQARCRACTRKPGEEQTAGTRMYGGFSSSEVEKRTSSEKKHNWVPCNFELHPTCQQEGSPKNENEAVRSVSHISATLIKSKESGGNAGAGLLLRLQ